MGAKDAILNVLRNLPGGSLLYNNTAMAKADQVLTQAPAAVADKAKAAASWLTGGLWKALFVVALAGFAALFIYKAVDHAAAKVVA